MARLVPALLLALFLIFTAQGTLSILYNRQTLHKLTLVTYIVALCDETRLHIEMFRAHSKGDFNASILDLSDDMDSIHPILYATDDDFVLFFHDSTLVRITKTSYDDYDDIFDVWVDGELQQSCSYHQGHRQHGVLIHLFKEGELLKIAPSSQSICERSGVQWKSHKRKTKKKSGSRLKYSFSPY